MANMVEAHKNLYYKFHEIKPDVKVGVAKYMTKTFQSSYNPLNKVIIDFLENRLVYGFVGDVNNELDFIGVNYYGKEKGFLPVIDNNAEYSEAGRAVHPEGFIRFLSTLIRSSM